MYAFPAVCFFLQCYGFSVAKISEVLQTLDCPVLLLSLVRYFSANILGFSTPRRRDGRKSVWCSAKDLAVRLSEFEMAEFGMSCKVFYRLLLLLLPCVYVLVGSGLR